MEDTTIITDENTLLVDLCYVGKLDLSTWFGEIFIFHGSKLDLTSLEDYTRDEFIQVESKNAEEQKTLSLWIEHYQLDGWFKQGKLHLHSTFDEWFVIFTSLTAFFDQKLRRI